MEFRVDGQLCLIDDADAPAVCASLSSWYLNGNDGHRYLVRRIDQRTLQSMHSFLMGDVGEGRVVDHINRNGLDNRRSNLRVCTVSQNMQNRKMASHNSSGFKGIYLDTGRPTPRWRASIRANGKVYRLGSFRTPEAAAMAYDRAAEQLHGEFAATNAALGLV